MVIPLPSLRACALVLVLLSMSLAGTAAARSATARITRVVTPVAMLEGVQVRLDWPAGAPSGQLRLRATRLDAPDLGYRFRNLDWRCPLRRDGGGWRCDGTVRSGGGASFRLAVDLDDAGTDARLVRGNASIAVSRDARTPDLTRVDLTRVPLAWTQALLARAWPDARLTGGDGDAQFTVATPPGKPVRLTGPLRLRDLSLDTPDGTIAAQGVGARLAVDATFVYVAGKLGSNEGVFRLGHDFLGQPRVERSPKAVHVQLRDLLHSGPAVAKCSLAAHAARKAVENVASDLGQLAERERPAGHDVVGMVIGRRADGRLGNPCQRLRGDAAGFVPLRSGRRAQQRTVAGEAELADPRIGPFIDHPAYRVGISRVLKAIDNNLGNGPFARFGLVGCLIINRLGHAAQRGAICRRTGADCGERRHPTDRQSADRDERIAINRAVAGDHERLVDAGGHGGDLVAHRIAHGDRRTRRPLGRNERGRTQRSGDDREQDSAPDPARSGSGGARQPFSLFESESGHVVFPAKPDRAITSWIGPSATTRPLSSTIRR